MRLFKLLHTPPFLITPHPPKKKIGIQENNQQILPWHSQDQKIFSKKLPTTQFRMPKKMWPKSQTKIKPQFPQYPFLTIFNPKKVSCEQIYDFKF